MQKFAILMLSCQSWVNFNTFEMILGGQTGGQEKIFFGGVANAHHASCGAATAPVKGFSIIFHRIGL